MSLTERLQGVKPLAARGAGRSNAVTIDASWGMDIQTKDGAVIAAKERLTRFLSSAFSLSLDGNEHVLRAAVAPGSGHGFSLCVSDDEIALCASTPDALVKGFYEIEAQMRSLGQAMLQKGNRTFTPRLWPRLAIPARDDGSVSALDADNLLEAGYDGVAVPSFAPFPEEARKAGLLCFLMCEETARTSDPYDGVIFSGKITDGALAFLSRFRYQVADTLSWPADPGQRKAIMDRLPDNAVVLSSFEDGASLTRGELSFAAFDGLLAVTEASGRFFNDLALAKQRGLTVWTRILTAGKIPYLANLMMLPGMMQHVLRVDGLIACGAQGTLETGGFAPSLVSDFYREALRTPCEEPGNLVQKLSARDFGAAQIETMSLIYKRISDAFSALVPRKEDLTPLAYGAAFPLTDELLYDLPENDVTLYTEQILTAADHFRKAQTMASRVPGENARELTNACGFAVNALVTLANVQRTARRQRAIAQADQPFKVKFLREQIVKIGREEMQNAEETMELIASCPSLCLLDSLCTPEFLEDKLVLTGQTVARTEEALLKKS